VPSPPQRATRWNTWRLAAPATAKAVPSSGGIRRVRASNRQRQSGSSPPKRTWPKPCASEVARGRLRRAKKFVLGGKCLGATRRDQRHPDPQQRNRKKCRRRNAQLGQERNEKRLSREVRYATSALKRVPGGRNRAQSPDRKWEGEMPEKFAVREVYGTLIPWNRQGAARRTGRPWGEFGGTPQTAFQGPAAGCNPPAEMKAQRTEKLAFNSPRTQEDLRKALEKLDKDYIKGGFSAEGI